MTRLRNKPQGKRKQRGAVAIEFAVLFMVFFMIVYAIIAYSVPFLLTLSFKQVSADAARSTVRVSPDLPTMQYIARINQQVHDVVSDSWLPRDWIQGDCPAPDSEGGWVALSDMNGKSLGHYLEVRSEPFALPRYHLNICLQREYNKNSAIIPILTVFGVDIPSLPKDEDGNTTLRGRSTIRL